MDKIKFLDVMDVFLTYRHEILTVSLKNHLVEIQLYIFLFFINNYVYVFAFILV